MSIDHTDRSSKGARRKNNERQKRNYCTPQRLSFENDLRLPAKTVLSSPVGSRWPQGLLRHNPDSCIDTYEFSAFSKK